MARWLLAFPEHESGTGESHRQRAMLRLWCVCDAVWVYSWLPFLPYKGMRQEEDCFLARTHHVRETRGVPFSWTDDVVRVSRKLWANDLAAGWTDTLLVL